MRFRHFNKSPKMSTTGSVKNLSDLLAVQSDCDAPAVPVWSAASQTRTG
jgi:hypothetical protein